VLFAATLAARLLLGFFLAGVFGGAIYLLGTVIMLSFGVPGPSVVLTSALISTGVGGGVGGFLSWMTLGGEWRGNLLTFGLVLAGAFAGAAIGLQIGYMEEASYERALAITGIPQLSGIITGAVIGANVPPLLHMLYRRLRGNRYTA